MVSPEAEEHNKKGRIKTGFAGIGMSAIIVPNPAGGLEQHLAQKEYFKALVLSTQYFDHYGRVRLREDFKKNGIQIDMKRIRRVEQVIVLLRACGIVNQDIYSKLFGVNKKRREVVHKVAARIVLDEKDTEKSIKDAIECVKVLYPR